MSYQPPDAHPQPDPPRQPVPPDSDRQQPAPPSQRHRRRWILSGAAVLGLAVGIGTLNGDDKTPPTGGPLKFDVTMTFAFSLPTGADVRLTAKVTEKSCRGEAGCAVTWHPQVVYSGPEISSNVPWTVIYRVVGYDTDGRVRVVEIDGTTPAKQPDEHVQTATSDSKIVLEVVDTWFGPRDIRPGVNVHLDGPVSSPYR